MHFRVVGMPRCSKLSTFINLIMTHNQNRKQHSGFVDQNYEFVKATTNAPKNFFYNLCERLLILFSGIPATISNIIKYLFIESNRVNCFFETRLMPRKDNVRKIFTKRPATKVQMNFNVSSMSFQSKSDSIKGQKDKKRRESP